MPSSVSSASNRSVRRIALALVLGVLLVAIGAPYTARLLADGDHQAAGPEQVRVVWTEQPQTEALIAWTTRSAGQSHRVLFDTESRGGKTDAYSHEAVASRNGRHSRREPAMHYHHARLTGLQPATTYWFVLVSDGAASREYHFVTAPADRDASFRFLSGGDSRSDPATRREMNRRMAALVEKDPGIIALAHGGDYVADGMDLGQWDQWLSDHQHLTTRNGRVLPVVPTRGNHEASGPIYDEIWGSPGGAMRNWFVTKLSPSCLLVTLNTETSMGGDQQDFLRQTLDRNQDVRWQLAQYHRPAWPAVKRPSGAKQHWVPLFERYNLDLVLESDGHVIKRTVPIRDDRQAADGVVYVGEGGLGVGQRRPDTGRWFLQSPGMTRPGHHVWVVGVSRDRLETSCIGQDGQTIDRWSRTPRPRVDAGEDF